MGGAGRGGRREGTGEIGQHTHHHLNPLQFRVFICRSQLDNGSMFVVFFQMIITVVVVVVVVVVG